MSPQKILFTLAALVGASGLHAQILPEISGLKMHMDANNSSSLVLDGNNLIQWSDSSGNNIAFGPSAGTLTYAANVVNGLGAIRFDGSSYINSTSANALSLSRNVEGITTFIVGLNFTTATQGALRINASGGARYASGTIGTDQRARIFARRNNGGTLKNVYADNQSVEINSWRIDTGMVNYAANTGSFYINGGRQGYTTNLFDEGPGRTSDTDATNFYIGFSNTVSSPQAWNGYIAEILVFDRALSEEEIAAINMYLSEKYNIAIPEPSTYALISAASMLALTVMWKRRKALRSSAAKA